MRSNCSKINFSIVVAMARNHAIGSNNQLLWHLPNDFKYFKTITMGKPIVMGRKTFESIGKPLPGRQNIIISSSLKPEDYNTYSDLKFFKNIKTLIEYLDSNYTTQEVMIIGGGEVYKQFMDYANKIYLTLVDAEINAEVYFPEIDKTIWQEVSRVTNLPDEKHKFNYSFIELARIV